MKFFTLVTLTSLLSLSLSAQETIKIPDIGLEEALIALNFDSNGLTGDILVSDVKYIVNLNINNAVDNKKLPNVNSKIKDLTGIEHFPNLTRLDCSGNAIRKINLTKSTKLTFLNCSDNKIETLDLSNSPELFSISCDYNKLTSLKLGNKPVLRDLYCNNNYLETLDITGCTAMKNLDASSNRMGNILIDKEVYDRLSEGWYKDGNAKFKESTGNTIVKRLPIETVKADDSVSTPQTKTQNVPSTKVTAKTTATPATESTANYYEKFQKSVVAEYDKLALSPDYLESKKIILQQKYDIAPSKLDEWITKYANLNKTNNAINPEKNSSIFHSKFKKSTVEEYERLVLNETYLQSKKEEIQKKYGIKGSDFNKWIELLGNSALKAKKEIPIENAASHYEKFKKSVVNEYENLVLNSDHFKTIKVQIQKKYNITPTQLNEWIRKRSTLKM
ncbi:conserved exported protein of unknown function [Tenacibaculum sp. 190130A14a]